MRQVARRLNRGVELRERLVVESIGFVALALQAGELLGASLLLQSASRRWYSEPRISLTSDSACSAPLARR